MKENGVMYQQLLLDTNARRSNEGRGYDTDSRRARTYFWSRVSRFRVCLENKPWGRK